jgi:hypothetical protein
MDDAVRVGVNQTPAHMLARLLDDNVDALYGHRHGDPGTIGEDHDFRLLSVEFDPKDVVRASQIYTVIFGRPDSPEDGYQPAPPGRVAATASDTPSQGVGQRPRRLDDDGVVDLAERHDDASTLRVEDDVVEIKPTAERKLLQPFGAGGMRRTHRAHVTRRAIVPARVRRLCPTALPPSPATGTGRPSEPVPREKQPPIAMHDRGPAAWLDLGDAHPLLGAGAAGAGGPIGDVVGYRHVDAGPVGSPGRGASYSLSTTAVPINQSTPPAGRPRPSG